MIDERIPVLFVVDSDPDCRDMIRSLAASHGCAAETFSTTDEFVARHAPEKVGVLILELPGQGIEALELPRRLRRDGIRLPMILMSGTNHVPTAVQAVLEGAVTFLLKPFGPEELWRFVEKGLALDQQRRIDDQARADFAKRFESLNEQERRILEMVMNGQLNKVISKRLDVSLRTVERLRAQILKKMNVQSVPRLIERVISKR